MKTFATIIGILTTVGTFTLAIHLIQNFISSIHVSSDPQHWATIARNQTYSLCYDGCNDCLDVSSIEKACHLTTKVSVQGILTCDATKMWFWDGEDRFPRECLGAIGEIWRKKAEDDKRFWWKALYILSVLAVPIGFLVGVFVLGILEARPVVRWGGGGGVNAHTPLLAGILIALVLPTQVLGYACIDRRPVYDQLFSNPDGTIFCERTNYSPKDYVDAAMVRVKKCGFRSVDTAPGMVEKRIANPKIEGSLWVKVAVNRFNGTEGGGLDDQVKCLYEMVENPKW